ncbi:MAG TPA: carboxypeptidase regulatory-like domain-containing protein, partial [Candidatus Acidoferrum sp.]|nr:carboxypeptidase regulatory-like domain-containing protein [Candidatus Acidoferrum sp.]
NGLDSEHLTFRLHPQAVIYGRVTDENGEAVRDATVRLFSVPKTSAERPSFQEQVQTNDLGDFRVAHLLAGRYCVVVETRPWYAQTAFSHLPDAASGNTGSTGVAALGFSHIPGAKPDLDVVYPVTFYPGVTNERSASELHLSEGETEQANIQIRAVPAVHIRMANLPSDRANQPGIAAVQNVFGSLPVGLAMQFTEVSPGEIEIAGLPPGDITFTLTPSGEPGPGTRIIEANVTGDGTVDASKPLPSANVSGRVILPEGFVETGDAAVMLLREGNSAAFTRLMKDGTFSLGAVPFGAYSILVRLSGQPKFIRNVSASGARANGRNLFIDGTKDVQLTVVMGQGVAEISGVAKQNGQPLDGVMVLLVPESGADLDKDSRIDQSDSDGSFLLSNIVPGKYQLLAIQDGWGLEWRNPAVLKPYLAKAQSLQIAANDAKKLFVDVQPFIK